MKVVSFRGQEFHFPDEADDNAIAQEMQRIGTAEASIGESLARIPRDLVTGYQRGVVGTAAIVQPFLGAQPLMPADYDRMRGPLGGDLDRFATPDSQRAPADGILLGTNKQSPLDKFIRETRDIQIANIEAGKAQAKAEADVPLDIFGAQKEIAAESSEITEKSGFSRPLISGTAQSVGAMLPVVVAGAAPGVGFPTAVGLGALQQGTGAYDDAYARYRAQDLSEDEADRKATKDAVISGAITAGVTTGFGPIFSNILGRTGPTGGIERILSKQSVGSAILEETGEEVTDQAAQLALESVRSNPNLTSDDVIGQLIQAGVGGATGAGLFKSGAKGIEAFARRIANKPKTPDEVQVDPATSKTSAIVNATVEKAAASSPAAAGVVAGMAGAKVDESILGEAIQALNAEGDSGNIAADTTDGSAPGPVMPDAPATINSQIELTLNPESTRAAVLLTPRTDGWMPDLDNGPGAQLDVVETPHGVVLFNPAKITEEEVIAAGAGENFDGRVLGMSTADRPAGGQSPDGLNVTTTGPDGTPDVLSQQVGSASEIPAAVAAGQAASPGGESTVTSNEELLRGRALRDEAARLAALRGDGEKAKTAEESPSLPSGATPEIAPQFLPASPEVPSIPGASQGIPALPSSAPQVSATTSEIQAAVDRSDIGARNVDIVASDEPYDVAFDPATKRFKVNPNRVTSPTSVTLKLNTHEKLHFVVDGLRDAGRDAEAQQLIDAMAVEAPEALIRQIQKYYAGSTTGELTEEQAAYAAQRFGKHFAKKGWFVRLTAMVSKVLSTITGDKSKASRVSAEMAAGRIQRLSEEFLAHRRSGQLPSGELKMSRPEIDVTLGVPSQRFGETEEEVRHNAVVIANVVQRLSENYLSPESPITPENTARFWEIGDGLADPENGLAFANQINADAGDLAAGANVMQSVLKIYAFRYRGATGDGSLDRYMQETALMMSPGTAKNNSEVAQQLQALQLGSTPGSTRDVAAQQMITAVRWVEAHKDPSGGASIGTDLLRRLVTRLVRPVTFDAMMVDPEKGSKVAAAIKALLEVQRRTRKPSTVPDPTDPSRGSMPGSRRRGGSTRPADPTDPPEPPAPKPPRLETPDRIVKRWIDRIEVEQTEWIKPDKKRNEVSERLRKALANKNNLTKEGTLFRTELQADLVAMGVNPDLANQVAFDINEKRLARFASRREAMLRLAGEGDLRKSDIAFLVKEMLAEPTLAQNSPQWRMDLALNFYLRRGLPRDQAVAATKLFEFVFRSQLADAQYAAAEKVVRQSVGVDGKVKLDTLPKIRAALRSQIANPDAPFAQALAEQYGWVAPFTKAQYEELSQIDAAMPRATRHEQAILTRRTAAIIRRSTMPPTWREKLAAYYVINALSGIPTIIVNASGTFMDSVTLVATETRRSITSSDPMARLNQTFQSLISAVNAFQKEIRFSTRRDAFVNLDFQELTRFNSLADLTQNALADLSNPAITGPEKLKAVASGSLGLLDVFRRILSTLDNSLSAGIRDFTETIGVRDGYRGTGLDDKRAYALARASHAVAPDYMREGRALGLSGNRLTMYVDDRIRDVMLSDARIAGVDTDSITQESKDILELATGNFSGKAAASGAFDRGTIFGVLGERFVGALETLSRNEDGSPSVIGRMAIGFLRVPFNRVQYAFNYSGAGLLRLAYRYAALKAGWQDPYEKSMRTSFQRQFIAMQGVVGVATFATLGFLLKDALTGDGDDKEEWIIDVTAGQIPSENDRRIMQANGIDPTKPNLFMRNKRTGEIRRLQASRGAIDPLAWWVMAFGAARDLQRRGKMTDEMSMENAGALAGQLLFGAAQITRNFGAGSISELGEKLSTAKGAAGTAGFMASGFTPAGSFVNSIRRVAEDKPSRETASTAFWSSFAYAPLDARKPALNWLGHPVSGEYTGIGARIADKASDSAFPIGVRLPASDPSWKIYKLFLEKGASPIAYHINNLQEKIGRVVTPDEWHSYVKMRGSITETGIRRVLPTLEKMPTETFDKAIDAISRKAGEEATTKLFGTVSKAAKKTAVKRELIAQ